jgi:prepilin-type N-terminal cleavage/methylation domain-containing protein
MTAPARGFTLVETVVSIAVLSIVMGALMSTMILATHALPGLDDPARLANEADAALEEMMTDAMIASLVTTDGAVLKMVVPDRTGDAIDETITFGLVDADTPPTDLYREFNGTRRVVAGRVLAMSVEVTSFEGGPRLLTVELASGHSIVRRASVDLMARPETTP